MKTEEYKILRETEDYHWWFVGLRKLIFPVVDGISKRKKDIRILDAGCGTGKVLDDFRDVKAFGIDFSEDAIRYCKSRNLDKLTRGSICSMPYKNNSFDIVTSLDVLYHRNVDDDLATLKEFYKVMKNGGILVLNLAAYDFLKSRHDEAVYTLRRYTRKGLKKKLEAAGFEIEKITYRNTILFPAAVFKRIFEKVFVQHNSDAVSELKKQSFLVNKLLMYILSAENKLISYGVGFPVGLSVYCIARKK